MTTAIPDRIDDYLVTARTLDEYAAMLALEPPHLKGQRVLDCPGGAASFTAQASAAGADAVAADPAYTLPPGDLSVRALDDARRSSDYVAAHAERYDWSSF